MSVYRPQYPDDDLPLSKSEPVVAHQTHRTTTTTPAAPYHRAAVVIAMQLVIIVMLLAVLSILLYNIAYTNKQTPYVRSRSLYANAYNGGGNIDTHHTRRIPVDVVPTFIPPLPFFTSLSYDNTDGYHWTRQLGDVIWYFSYLLVCFLFAHSSYSLLALRFRYVHTSPTFIAPLHFWFSTKWSVTLLTEHTPLNYDHHD